MRVWVIYALVGIIWVSATLRAQETSRQVWVFYLGFWAGEATWQWNTQVLDDKPLLGYYNAKLPAVAAAQILQAKSAGIDAFLVSWFGLDEQVTTTPTLNNLLDRAAELDFKIGVVVDIFPDEFNRDRDKLVQSLRWLVQERSAHPAYLHYHGKPVIAFAFQNNLGWTAAEWLTLRETVDPQYKTLWLSEGLSACCLYGGAMDGMYAFNMAWASGNKDHYIAERNIVYAKGGTVYVPTISPGWDEDKIAKLTGRRNPTSRRDRNDGLFLRQSWQGALAAETDVIMVVTWNEFIENSHIEPSERYGTQALDILRDLATAWKGAPPTPIDHNPPACYSASSSLPADIFAEADTSSPLIGQLSPHTAYQIIGENNGLYHLRFDPQTGYVPSSDLTLAPCFD